MFLIGKKTSELKSDTSKEVICPKCYAPNTTKVAVIGIYKHLFQIPLVPGGKTGESNCSKCQQTFTPKNMPATIKLAYYELKETTRIPVWFYTGLIAIKILVLIKIFSKFF